MLLLDVFAGVMMPLILLAGLGALVSRRAGLLVGPLSILVFNLFIPALVFTTIITVDIDADIVPRIAAVVAGVSLLSGLVGVAAGRLLRWSPRRSAATGLALGVINLGNMGIPVSGLAFGPEGLAVAVVAFIVSAMLNNSFGIVLASTGEGVSVGRALLAPLRVPAMWVLPPAFVVRIGGLKPGAWLMEPTALLADASIPLMLVVLGLQVTAHRPRLRDLTGLATPIVVRLIGGPLLAYGLTVLVGVEGVVQHTLIVLGGMPPAVVGTIIATRHDADPTWVAQTVMFATLASFVTLTGLIALLS